MAPIYAGATYPPDSLEILDPNVLWVILVKREFTEDNPKAAYELMSFSMRRDEQVFESMHRLRALMEKAPRAATPEQVAVLFLNAFLTLLSSMCCSTGPQICLLSSTRFMTWRWSRSHETV